MNIEDINLGDPPTGAGGDTMRTAFGKTNQNFGAAKQALEDEVQSREQLLATQRDQLIALIESVNGPLPNLRADFKARSFGFKNETGLFLPCGFGDVFSLSAPSPRWVWNAQGQLVEVPANQPAYNHDPVTGESLGFDVESASTNLCPFSSDLGSWNNNQGVTVSSVVDERFPWAVSRITETETNGYHLCQDIQSPADSVTNVCSFIFKNESTRRYMVFARSNPTSSMNTLIYDLQEEVFINIPASWTADAKALGGGYISIYFTVPSWVTSGGGGRITVGLSDGPAYGNSSYMGDAANSLLIAHVQREQSSKPSSSIYTNGSAVTRAADVPVIENVDTAEWFRGDEGWCFIKFDQLRRPEPLLVDLLVAGANQRFFYFNSNSEEIRAYDGSTLLQSGVAGFNKPMSAILTWSASNGRRKILALGGSVVTGLYSGSFSSSSTISIMGQQNGSVLLQGLRFGKKYLSDAEMQRKLQELT